mmetsp:Transcript_75823/g.218968  ORF Transcript_75823/g.218968 Transcript_75823/m.218968 type:complete len:84 (+) Transcript_75823:103-354(+)
MAPNVSGCSDPRGYFLTEGPALTAPALELAGPNRALSERAPTLQLWSKANSSARRILAGRWGEYGNAMRLKTCFRASTTSEIS